MRRTQRLLTTITLGITVGGLAIVAQQQETYHSVAESDLRAGLKDATRWLTFSGDYTGQRHSPLTQLTPDNVSKLVPQWIFQSQIPAPNRGMETTPIVIDGVMYITGVANQAWALDARTGKTIWSYRRTLPQNFAAYVCCGPVNRGFAILGDRLYMGTLDSHLLALDRKTGSVLWDVPVGELTSAQAITMAPLVIKDKVIIGVAGGDFATRGFLDAYDASTGKRAWRFYIIPDQGEPGFESWPNADAAMHGGGSAWVTGSYDPDLNLLYFGTSNPNPSFNGDNREGDNLYTCSLIALDLDSGKLKWHYQFSPHDLHDWDANQVPVQADLTINGTPHKVIMQANRNGFFYTLDRATGKLLLAKPFTEIAKNWAKEIGPDGRPVVLDNIGTKDKCLADYGGGTNFQPPSYDPVRHLFLVTAYETCNIWESIRPKGPNVLGKSQPSGRPIVVPEGPRYSALRAIDPATGTIRWEHRYPARKPNQALGRAGGVLTAGSGLTFTGDDDGLFHAFETNTGKELWQFAVGASIWGAAPISFMLDGRQWVVTPSGVSLMAFAIPTTTTPSR